LLVVYGAAAFTVLQNQWAGGWLEIWNRWDAPHYLDIARQGYVSTGEESRWIVFYPLYPWLVRVAAFVLRDYLLSAFLVSALASVAAALLLQRLAALDVDERAARAAVFFMLAFPTAYFLHVGYTESLFMALALGSFLAARRRAWRVAGILGALAALSRVNGLLLIPALAVEAYAQYRDEGRRQPRPEWAWIALVASGFVVYLALNQYALGDPLAFLSIQKEHWFRSFTWPWVSVGDAWRSAQWRTPSDAVMVGWMELLFALLGLGGTIWCAFRLRASYAVWMGANWLLWTSTKFLLSVPRYTLIMFPVYILFARAAVKRPALGGAIALWSLLLLALFAAQFARGHWAF
jgi:Gpi18-like mannosyltransferase